MLHWYTRTSSDDSFESLKKGLNQLNNDERRQNYLEVRRTNTIILGELTSNSDEPAENWDIPVKAMPKWAEKKVELPRKYQPA